MMLEDDERSTYEQVLCIMATVILAIQGLVGTVACLVRRGWFQ